MPRVLIVIRVLVNESEQINEQGVFKMLRVQEEIVEVDKQALTQIKVTQLVLKLDSANNELIGKRVVTTIELKDSDVHKIPRDKDNHRYPDGKYCLWLLLYSVSYLLFWMMVSIVIHMFNVSLSDRVC